MPSAGALTLGDRPCDRGEVWRGERTPPVSGAAGPSILHSAVALAAAALAHAQIATSTCAAAISQHSQGHARPMQPHRSQSAFGVFLGVLSFFSAFFSFFLGRPVPPATSLFTPEIHSFVPSAYTTGSTGFGGLRASCHFL